MKTTPDIQYMLRLKEGDSDAFGVLFKKYQKKIINFCYRFSADRAVAEELAQEVFIRVYKAAPRYRPKAEFSTWIFRIATNVCLNETRKRQYKVKIDSVDVPVHKGEKMPAVELEDPARQHEMLESADQERLILHALGLLPSQQRAALLLKVYNDFSYQEIASQLRCSENTVKGLIHRGRQHIKKFLKDDL